MEFVDNMVLNLDHYLFGLTPEKKLQVLREFNILLQNKLDKFWLEEVDRILGKENA